MPDYGGRESSSHRASTSQHAASYQRVGAVEGNGGQPGGQPVAWEDVRKRSRGQLALVTAVVLVLMLGAATTIHDKLRPAKADTEQADIGAPAVTGAPAARYVDAPGPSGIEGVEKVGAGIMFLSGGEVLLLKRNSLHHHDKWGLPGGNIEESDNDLLDTAKREATEELGELPHFQLKGEILTKRGKQDQKHYTVFLAAVTPEAKAAYKPKLNEEHSAWQWYPLEEAFKMDDLHPVVKRVFKKGAQHRDTVLAAAAPEAAAAEAP